jgi:glucokinase
MHDPQMMVQERLIHANWGFLGSQGYILGLDICSYGLRAALVDLQKHAYTHVYRDIQTDNVEKIFADVVDLAQGLLAAQRVPLDRLVRIGAGFGGPVDAHRGVVLLSHRIPGWEQFPLQERLETAFGATTMVDNDANLIALAEATFGVGREKQHLFYVHLSRGVGGGLVLDGRLFHGATTTAGEIGHAVVGPVDPIFPKRPPGTLEQHLSIDGLLRRAADLGLQTDRLEDIFSDNPASRQVVAEAVDILAARLSQIVALIDPQIIVLGGVVTRYGGNAFIDAVQTRMYSYMASLIDRPVPIVASQLGFESVAIGGLALALASMSE